MKPAFLLPACALLLPGVLLTASAARADEPNPHLKVVLDHLADVGYKLPAGDFILLAIQPLGIADTTIVYDLDKGAIALVPGHHSDPKRESHSLAKEKAKLLRDVV